MDDRTIAYQRPWLADYQLAHVFNDARYALIEASTKSGKTVGCEVWLLEQAMQGEPGWPYLWLSPSVGQARMAYDGEDGIKRWVANSGIAHLCKTNDTERTVELPNRTVIWFKTGEKPDLIYGPGYYAVVIDEASRVREEAWHAVRSTITKTRAPVRMIGNVKGRKNWFYRFCRRAEAGEPDTHYARITWEDAVAAGLLDAEEIEAARRELPEGVFEQLYGAVAADDEGNPFGLRHIQECADRYTPPAKVLPVVWGWDLARAVDWCVGIGLDAGGRVCAVHRFQEPWEETFTRIKETTGETPAVVDATAMGGDIVVERLQRQVGPNFHGYPFTQRSKQTLMEGLAVAIQHHEISFPPGPITVELEAFEYQYTRTGVKYTAPDGMHDDCVDALALAVYGWKTLTGRPELPEEEYSMEEVGGFVL